VNIRFASIKRSYPIEQSGTVSPVLAVHQRGATRFEFLLQAVLLISLILVMVDLCALAWVSISMQSALQVAVKAQEPGATRDPAILIARIKQHSHGLYDKLSPGYIVKLNGVAASYYSPANYRQGMFGKPGEPVEIELDCSWPLLTPLVSPFFPDGQYRFSIVQTIATH